MQTNSERQRQSVEALLVDLGDQIQGRQMV